MGDFSLLATRIKELRKSFNKTQREFADHVGCTAATLSAYENGSKSPSLEIVKNIAEKCGTSLDWLCGLTDKKNYNEDIKSYADMFRLIIKLCEIQNSTWEMSYEDGGKDARSMAKLVNRDSDVAKFFKDWEQMIKLYKNNTIDQHLYNLWLSDKLKYYKEFSLDDLPFEADPALQGEITEAP